MTKPSSGGPGAQPGVRFDAAGPPPEGGALILCPTPIGNLGDITARAVEALRTADLICAEDTRRTGRLLQHLGIHAPLWSLHEHNEAERCAAVLARIQSGERVVLVSDAGTPGIADPGFMLVRTARAQGLPVISLPGASAFLVALVGSGLPTDRFLFLGFAPRRAAERAKFLEAYRTFPHTMIFYESPHRIRALISDLARFFGPGRPAVLARELTKMHEQWLEGELGRLASSEAVQAPRGEWVVVVAGAAGGETERPDEERLAEALACMRRLVDEGVRPAEAARRAAAGTGVPRGRLYRSYLGKG